MFFKNSIIMGVIINLLLTSYSVFAVSTLVNYDFYLINILIIFTIREMAASIFFGDYKLSLPKSSSKTISIKNFSGILAFLGYAPLLYFMYDTPLDYLIIELIFFLFTQSIILSLYQYYYFAQHSSRKTKNMVIYGAGVSGMRIKSDYKYSEYKLLYFIDDDKDLYNSSIDGINIVPKDIILENNYYIDLLIIAIPSANRDKITQIHDELKNYVKEIRNLPSIDSVLNNKLCYGLAKDVTIDDLLARRPKDLNKTVIKKFLHGKVILITGAGGSIGSELARQSKNAGAKKLILVDHSEFNLYKIDEELKSRTIIPILQSVTDGNLLEKIFAKYKPEIVIHAAAYKHVPLVEGNIDGTILNNVLGTQNCIDISIKHNVKKFVLISTDKAVRPANVMGASKRVCELYSQNVVPHNTEIVAVRFGNVLGTSGSVLPKFKKQLESGQDLTVTHPDITRYFMLIQEACELVLQAALLGKGGEIFILDMGEPVRITDLAKKMIELSGKDEIKIKFTGLRKGEKLYEELLLDDSDKKTKYEFIMVAKPTFYDISKLSEDIEELLKSDNKIKILKKIVPEFNHNEI